MRYVEYEMKRFLSILILFLLCASAYAGDVVDKKYREQFLTPYAAKNYYRTQINVSGFFSIQTSAVNNIIESYRGTSIWTFDPFSNKWLDGRGGVLDGQAFTYDNAVAALAYLVCDQPYNAEKILDAYRQEFYVIKNDNYGLFNSYRTDKEATQYGMSIGIDGDRMHVGPNAWMGIAALQYTAVTGKLDFLKFAIDMSKWIDGLPHFIFANGKRGSVSMGSGWGPDWTKTFSTENVVDDYALKKMLKEIYMTKDPKVRKIFEQCKYTLKDINREMSDTEKWLMLVVYDKNKKAFNVGYNENGIDTTDALDAVSWVISAISPEKLASMGVDPYQLMKFADNNFYFEDNVEGIKIKGYDFTNIKSREKNYRMIWLEGTGFHVVAMQRMAQYSHLIGYPKRAEYFQYKAEYFLNEMQKVSQLCTMVDGALPYTSKKLKDNQTLTTFKWEWEIPRGRNGQWVASASSTAWYIMAMSAFNPLEFDREHVLYKLFVKQA